MSNRTPSTNGRNGNGRFAKGNAGGPGNPHARNVARLRSMLLGALTEADFKAVIDKLIEQAKAGDLAAVKLLLAYAVGKPTDPPCDPDRVDEHEAHARADALKAQTKLQDAALDAGVSPDSE